MAHRAAVIVSSLLLSAACGGPGVGGGGSGGDGGSGADAGVSQSGSISGTLFAPPGENVQGSEVLACVLTASGDCDLAKSVSVNIVASGSSTPFSIEGVASETYYLIGAKDMNSSGELDEGDLVGGHLDFEGNWLPVVAPASGTIIKMVTLPSTQAPAPAALVGTWGSGGSEYVIRADGTYDWVLIYSTSLDNCLIYLRMDFTASGRISVSGDQITFVPTEGTSTKLRCNGDVLSSLEPPNPSVFTYRIAPGDQNVTTLYLTNEHGESAFRKR